MKCPRCAAVLRDDGSAVVPCAYCGARIEVSPERTRQQRAQLTANLAAATKDWDLRIAQAHVITLPDIIAMLLYGTAVGFVMWVFTGVVLAVAQADVEHMSWAWSFFLAFSLTAASVYRRDVRNRRKVADTIRVQREQALTPLRARLAELDTLSYDSKR
ncbi:MAG TPA: hypothetical protein VJZ00_10470 [Thermoanaerobaculia bacterium]|nr:hypothetical protein [Thermoanaerobaculia bacterium]